MTLVRPLPADVRALFMGGYSGSMRNALQLPGETCRVCFTPVSPGFSLCIQCNDRRLTAGLADHVGAIIYAVNREQSHHYMRLYKAPATPLPEHQYVVQTLLWQALTDHGDCLSRLSTMTPTYWSTVPSLSGRTGTHPLNTLARPIMTLPELPLLAVPDAASGAARGLSGFHFSAPPLPPRQHVLIIDDTWVSGGHAQSAALAVRQAGAEEVSILNIARFLKPPWQATVDFLKRHRSQDLTSSICCWTGAVCP